MIPEVGEVICIHLSPEEYYALAWAVAEGRYPRISAAIHDAIKLWRAINLRRAFAPLAGAAHTQVFVRHK